MLIHYSIASFELLERKLRKEEKEELFNVFYRVGHRMGLKELPSTYDAWLIAREVHMKNDLAKSNYTEDLFRQYKKHLGVVRYKVLTEAQLLVIPQQVKDLLQPGRFSILKPIVPFYKLTKLVRMDWLVKKILLPATYKKQIAALDVT
jgi:hypothetical protein